MCPGGISRGVMGMRLEPGFEGRAAASPWSPRARGRRDGFVLAWLGGALASAVIGLTVTPAHAQEKAVVAPAAPAAPASADLTDMDRARALAKQASRALQKAQSYAEALDYATRAEALYHAPIHLAIIAEALVIPVLIAPIIRNVRIS